MSLATIAKRAVLVIYHCSVGHCEVYSFNHELPATYFLQNPTAVFWEIAYLVTAHAQPHWLRTETGECLHRHAREACKQLPQPRAPRLFHSSLLYNSIPNTMPVAFGFSVGDFIATLNLVQNAIEALSSTNGASTSYRALIRELYVLESALLRVKDTELEPELESEKRALVQTASQCQHTIDDFLTKVQAYQPHLRVGGSGSGTWSRTKDAWMKIKWALCKEEDVEKFKADVRGHSASIQLLVQAIEMFVFFSMIGERFADQ